MSHRRSHTRSRRVRKIWLVLCLLIVLLLIYLGYTHKQGSDSAVDIKDKDSSQINTTDVTNSKDVLFGELIRSSKNLDAFIESKKSGSIANMRFRLDYVDLNSIDWQEKAVLPIQFDIPMGREVENVKLVGDSVEITVLSAPEGCLNPAVQQWYTVFVEVDADSNWSDKKQANFVYKKNPKKCDQPDIKIDNIQN